MFPLLQHLKISDRVFSFVKQKTNQNIILEFFEIIFDWAKKIRETFQENCPSDYGL